MATVRLTDSLIEKIVTNSSKVYEESEGPVPVLPEEITSTLADRVYDYVLPVSSQNAYMNDLPPWMQIHTSDYAIVINGKQMRAPLSKPKPSLERFNTKIYNIPSVPVISLSYGRVVITLDEDAYPHIDSELAAVASSIDGVRKELMRRAKEQGDIADRMRKFLKGHSTLQSAVKEFGPALFKFVDSDVIEQYKRVRTPSAKTDTKPEAKEQADPVDVSDIIGRVTAVELKD